MGFKVEVKNFPNIGYYIIKLEDSLYVCYKNKNKEAVFETMKDAQHYCSVKLKEEVNFYLKKKR